MDKVKDLHLCYLVCFPLTLSSVTSETAASQNTAVAPERLANSKHMST